MSIALSMPATGDGLVGNWSPGIGDASFVGWLTVIAYLVTGWRCYLAARRITGPMAALSDARREKTFWAILTALFLMLGINKQLDLQSLLTEIGRILARDEGWYEERASVQRAFILVVGALGVAAAGAAIFLVRRATRGAWIAALGATLVTAFVVIRAASFHHIDRMISISWFGLKTNWLLELSGIAVVLYGTIVQARAFRRR